MDKVTFKYKYSFKYNEKDFIFLYSKKCPFYMLEIKDNKLDYPDLNDFVSLYEKFNLSRQEEFIFNKESFSQIQDVIKEKTLTIAPRAKTATGAIALAMVVSLCGCSKHIPYDPPVSTTSGTSSSQNESMTDYFKKYNISVDERIYDKEPYYFVKDSVTNTGKYQVTFNTLDEFKEHTSLTFKPTFKDVEEAFLSNPNIDSEKKEIIINGLKNIENDPELNGLDLSVLYINAKRMRFIYLTHDELCQMQDNKNIYGFFESDTGIVYLPSDTPLEGFEFMHEVLGHGALSYREDTEDEKYIYDCTNNLMILIDNRYTNYSIGTMISEGGANIIARSANGGKVTKNFYELFEEQIRLIARMCNVTIGELLNNKGISLYDLMYQNDIDSPVEYIFESDGICKGLKYCEISDTFERLVVDATEEKLEGLSDDEKNVVIENTIRIINETHFQNGLSYSYPGGSFDYDPSELSENVQSKLRQ